MLAGEVEFANPDPGQQEDAARVKGIGALKEVHRKGGQNYIYAQ